MLKPIFIFIFLLSPFFGFAQNYPDKPLEYVTDEANVLNDEQEALLNAKLKEFELTSSNQIFVYTKASLNGNDMANLSQEIFHHWQIGGEKNNNGVLIAVFVNDHKFRIHTGYGLEGALPDLLTRRIQDNYMRPLFKANNFYEGINSGIDQLIYYSAHEYKTEEKAEQPVDLTSWFLGYGINALLLVIVIVILYKKNQVKKRKPITKHLLLLLALVFALFPCIGAILLFFMAMFTANLKLARGSGGTYSSTGSGWSDSSWGSSSSSDSYSDSSSSSDFGGGGGGDSGGGGSSSDW